MIFGNDGKVLTEDTSITTEQLSMIMEVAILESLNPDELSDFLGDANETQTALRDEVLVEKTIVRLDKAAKITRAQKLATFTIAKERNDPQFKKLMTVWRMERFLEAQLFKKYGSEAMRRARVAVNNAQKSKSGVVQKAAKNLSKQLNSSIRRGA